MLRARSGPRGANAAARSAFAGYLDNLVQGSVAMWLSAAGPIETRKALERSEAGVRRKIRMRLRA